MESFPSTENLSAALKSSSSAERGLWAENTVIEFLLEKKWDIISIRTKYRFGEIDIVVQRQNQIALVEVKSLHSEWMSFERVSKKQISRLNKNFNYLIKNEFKKNDVKLFLCFVDYKKNIKWVGLTD